MSSKITGKEYPLLKIFSSDFEYHVPAYQRPYAWTTGETSKLFNDLYEFFVSEDNDNYFLGTIVLIKDDNKPYADVVDGQQRLTTLTILFSVMATFFTDEETKGAFRILLEEKGNIIANIPNQPRLFLRARDQEFFNKYIQRGNLDDLMALDVATLKTEAQVHIKENCQKLKELFSDTFEGDEKKLLNFSSFLVNRCFLVVVSSDNQESAFRIFSVMNSRGLNLLPVDIIKSEVIGKLPESEQDSYTEKWEALENLTGREGFNEVFTHTRTIFAKERPKKNLLEEFRDYVLPQTSSTDLIDKYLDPYCTAYVCLKNQKYESSQNAEKVNNILYWLNKIDNYDWMPPSIKFFSEHANEPAYVLWFVGKLERLASYLYVTAKDVNQRMDRYKLVLAEMDKRPSHNIKEPLETIELTMNEKKSFIEALNGEVYNMPSRRRNYIIQRLDSFVSDGAARYDTKIFSIEHVLPQNPSSDSEWNVIWSNREERVYWLNRIANLVPLTRQRNSQAQNYDFETKKTKYFQNKDGVTSYALTTQVINVQEWTPDTVQKRQDELLKVFMKQWNLGNDKDVPDVKYNKPLFYLVMRGSNATGVAGEGTQFIVKKGSIISTDTTPSFQSSYAQLRKELIEKGIVKDGVFVEDYTFDSVSAAACVVGGRSANGRREWSTIDGVPYSKIVGK